MRPVTDGVTTIEYDVQSPEPMSCSTAAHVARELIKHLLFMRNQAPALIDELAAKVPASQPPVFAITSAMKLLDASVVSIATQMHEVNSLADPDTPRRRGTRDRKISKASFLVASASLRLGVGCCSCDHT